MSKDTKNNDLPDDVADLLFRAGELTGTYLMPDTGQDQTPATALTGTHGDAPAPLETGAEEKQAEKQTTKDKATPAPFKTRF